MCVLLLHIQRPNGFVSAVGHQGKPDGGANGNRTARTTELIAGRVDSSIAAGEVRQIMSDLSLAAAELRRSTSTISAMATKLSASQGHLDRFLVSGDSVLTKINAGQGTLGLLVNDSSLYIGSDSLVAQLRQLVTDIKANPKRYLSVRLF